MLSPVLIDRVLCLPAPDITALIDGQVIVAMPKVQVQQGWNFALYPCDLLTDTLPVHKQYHPYFQISAQASLASLDTSITKIEAWAKCERYMMIYELEQLKSLPHSTIWTETALQELLKKRQPLLVAYLRVYKLADAISVSANSVTPDKHGKFVSFSALNLIDHPLDFLKVSELLPVLDEATFIQRKESLEQGKSPLYSELRSLQGAVFPHINTSPIAKRIDQEIRTLLSWGTASNVSEQPDPDLDWIKTITDVGNSSDGYEFERLVRKSLIKLGFTNSLNNPKASLDPDGMGGAGGIDVYCDAPFSLVGECKASKHESVPNGVSAQLIHLGTTHLGKSKFEESVKVIFAAGSLTNPAEKAAIENQMNVMRPDTLQRLLEVKAKYQGSIDLLALEPCLKEAPFGEESDTKINRYIDKVLENIKMRSQLVDIVRQLTRFDKKQLGVSDICNAYNFTVFGLDKQASWLDNQTVYELLIELSSPLVGYLGRIPVGGLSSDCFYYLRDLPVE